MSTPVGFAACQVWDDKTAPMHLGRYLLDPHTVAEHGRTMRVVCGRFEAAYTTLDFAHQEDALRLVTCVNCREGVRGPERAAKTKLDIEREEARAKFKADTADFRKRYLDLVLETGYALGHCGCCAPWPWVVTAKHEQIPAIQSELLAMTP